MCFDCRGLRLLSAYFLHVYLMCWRTTTGHIMHVRIPLKRWDACAGGYVYFLHIYLANTCVSGGAERMTYTEYSSWPNTTIVVYNGERRIYPCTRTDRSCFILRSPRNMHSWRYIWCYKSVQFQRMYIFYSIQSNFWRKDTSGVRGFVLSSEVVPISEINCFLA